MQNSWICMLYKLLRVWKYFTWISCFNKTVMFRFLLKKFSNFEQKNIGEIILIKLDTWLIFNLNLLMLKYVCVFWKFSISIYCLLHENYFDNCSINKLILKGSFTNYITRKWGFYYLHAASVTEFVLKIQNFNMKPNNPRFPFRFSVRKKWTISYKEKKLQQIWRRI